MKMSLDELLGESPAAANGTAAKTAKPVKQTVEKRETIAVTEKPVSARSASSSVLYFDLETIPDYDRMECFDLEPIPEPAKRGEADKCPPVVDLLKQTLDKIKEDLKFYNPENSYLDALDAAEKSASKPRKGVLDLTADLRKQDQARDDALIARRKLMSVTPEYCRIVALGFSIGNQINNAMVVDTDMRDKMDAAEAKILEHFWTLAKSVKSVCGFNVLGFDLPVIFVRSMLLDVAPSRDFDLKPWSSDVIDLMAKRFPRSGAMGLKKLAKVMGIHVPAGDVDGSQVEELWRTNPAKVGEYVRSDIEITKALHRKYQGYFC